MEKVLIIMSMLLFSTAATAHTLTTASYVDISRYIGKWYAIKALPQFFTRNCRGQTAEYKILDPKTISVLNTCLRKNGYKSISGKAVVKNPKTNAELIVTFNNFFTRLFRVKGDYTIIKLDPNYEFVMVGSKDRNSLWIMSRKTTMPANVLEEYTSLAKAEGFPVTRMRLSKF